MYKVNNPSGTIDAAVSPGNSGGASGDAWNGVILSAGTMTYDDDVRHRFPASIRHVGSGSGTSYGYWNFPGTMQWSAQMYVTLDDLLTAEGNLLWVGNGTTRIATCGLLATGRLIQRDASGTAGTGMSAGAGSEISPDAVYRLDFAGTVSSSSAVIRSRICVADSDTPLAALEVTGKNTGSLPVTVIRMGGRTSSATASATIWTMAHRANDEVSTFYDVFPFPPDPTIQKLRIGSGWNNHHRRIRIGGAWNDIEP